MSEFVAASTMLKKKKGTGCATQVAQQPGISYVGCFVLVMLFFFFCRVDKLSKIWYLPLGFCNSHKYMEFFLKAGRILPDT